MTRDKAEAHWIFIEGIILQLLKLMRFLFVEAMIHGAKHERDNRS